MAEIKAIETVYKGYRFRSRLEARWAIFFDGIGLKWEYEPVGISVGDHKYLADFRLPKFDYFIEIKPNFDLVSTWADKLEEVSRHLKLIVIVGNPWPYEYDVCVNLLGSLVLLDGQFSLCSECEGPGLVISEYNGSRKCGMIFDSCKSGCKGCACWPRRTHSDDYQSMRDGTVLRSAYLKARQSRFEHGESP